MEAGWAFLFMLCFVFVTVNSAATGKSIVRKLQLQSEKDALLSIKRYYEYHTGIKASRALFNWSAKSDEPCLWNGITCEIRKGQTHIVSVNVSRYGLSGGIPLEFNRLMPNLKYLDLSLNILRGEFPDRLFSRCPRLRVLTASYNKLAGELPLGLLNCKNLRVLDVGFNKFNGSVAPEFARMEKLQMLILCANNFSGRIPAEFLNTCGSLNELNIAKNSITGGIPSIKVNCSSLRHLHLSSNKLGGRLSDDLGLLTNLQSLTLENNGFTGTIPSELGNLSRLKFLAMSINNLFGSIPVSLGKLRNLEILTLENNSLTGQIPAEFGNFHHLRSLNLNYNRLTGKIPKHVWRLQSLVFLFLGSNYLEGIISSEVGNLSHLQALDLGNNMLKGRLPSTIGKLQHLLWLSVSRNRLRGRLPPEIGNCSSLIWLNAGYNLFSGTIPSSMGLIGRHAQQTFKLNNETGITVSKELITCGSMLRWYPYVFVPLSMAITPRRCMNFWHHTVRGIPYPAVVCSKYRGPTGYIELSGNRLRGEIPESLRNITTLIALLLADNMLSSHIPVFLADMPLVFLNLSHNRFYGPIPAELSNLKCLYLLDLQRNALEGEVPNSLTKLSMLTIFNLSYNVGLQGRVPADGQFITFTRSSYIGDINLCLGSEQALEGPCAGSGSGNGFGAGFGSGSGSLGSGGAICSTCHEKSPSSGLTWEFVLIILAIGGALSIISPICWMVATWFSRSPGVEKCRSFGGGWGFRRRVLDSPSERVVIFASLVAERMKMPLTYRDMVKATDNFSQSRVIGRGGFGVVYKGDIELKDGDFMSVAIKRLDYDTPRVQREFMAEIQTLGRLRHPNLAPLLGCCVAGKDILLIYKMMQNGSLDDRLYEVSGKLSDFRVRLQIAAGAAQGLSFLHHDCRPVIVHRDIKPSNILLDHNLHAVLTDFGLARMLSLEDTHVSTTLVGTLGYVPPEYSQSWRATVRGDIFSFGVILMELASGKRPLDEDMIENYTGGTIDWARTAFRNGRIDQMIDPVVKTWIEAKMGDAFAFTARRNVVSQFVRIAYDCTHDRPDMRPSMRQVAEELKQLHHEFIFVERNTDISDLMCEII